MNRFTEPALSRGTLRLMARLSTHRAYRIALLAPALTALLLAPLAVAAGLADPGLNEPDTRLRSVLERFDEAQASIHRISANFREVKTLALLKEPVVQSGRFFHTKPDKFLWEYTNPEQKSLMLNGKTIIGYYPEQKRAEEIQTRFSKRIVKYMGLGSVLTDLTDEYEIALSEENRVKGTDLIVLTPKKRRIKKRLAEIRIWLDRELSQPRQMEYLESDGDKTLFTFSNIQINPEINLSKYEITFPDDVEVTKNLTGFFAGTGSR
jgi:outer membrane lipoprotein-sorting protein